MTEEKTVSQIQKEVEALQQELKVLIDQFLKSNPDIDLQISIEKREYTLTNGRLIFFDHDIKVII